ncbi:NusG domain II-containing protein, partial [Megasphaera sp.]
MKHIIKKGDIVLIITLLVLSFIPEGIFYLTGNDASVSRMYAVIQVDGKVYKEVPLSGHHGTDVIPIQTEEGYNLVVIQDESVGITEADCPDKICIS